MGLTTAIIVLVAALVILALGAALLVVCRALSTASTQLTAILETIGTASAQADPAGPVLASIKDDLAAANKLLVPLLASKSDAPTGAQRRAPRAALNGADQGAPRDAATIADGGPPTRALASPATQTPASAGQPPRADSDGSPGGEPGRSDSDH